MKITLTEFLAEEVRHKLGVLADTPELQEDYHLSQEQAAALLASVTIGEWEVPEWGVKAVLGELANHAVVLRDMAHDARMNNDKGGALRLEQAAARLDAIAEGYRRLAR